MAVRIVFGFATPKINPNEDKKLILVCGSKDQGNVSTKAEVAQTWNQSDQVGPYRDLIPGALGL